MAESTEKDGRSNDQTEQVVVEKSLGPMHGYYHNQENGTHMESEKMSRGKAEELGYSRCRSCFPEAFNDSE